MTTRLIDDSDDTLDESLFTLRVWNGRQQVHFEGTTDGLVDAIGYAEACLFANRVERLIGGTWLVQWRDGEASGRPCKRGGDVHIPYRASLPADEPSADRAPLTAEGLDEMASLMKQWARKVLREVVS